MIDQIVYSTVSTPLGEMSILAVNTGICLLEYKQKGKLKDEISVLEKKYQCTLEEKDNEHTLLLKKELEAYFQGSLDKFTVPLVLNGTDFQKQVWQELLTIPYATTRTYKEQSIAVGDLKAIRAVASANGRNKISIVVPCHRVIGSDGSLTGYAGGLDRKRFLLNLEREFGGPKDLFS